MTVSAFSSVSLSPPFVLVSIGHDASIFPAIAAAEWIGISILAENQEALSRRFAETDADRFDDLGLQRGQHGVALLDGALAHLECRIVARHESGDHTLVVASVEQAAAHDGQPLVYFRGGYTQLDR
jgi:flavin reductase (DIM6/NTAB) family NADH-FMN oxidoreductase RutF